uniref:Uncharacterized protein n=1 Tax=viral metagenome TaxID=1070528 RepID=A0A6C0BCI9_9ZZZZ
MDSRGPNFKDLSYTFKLSNLEEGSRVDINHVDITSNFCSIRISYIFYNRVFKITEFWIRNEKKNVGFIMTPLECTNDVTIDFFNIGSELIPEFVALTTENSIMGYEIKDNERYKGVKYNLQFYVRLDK